MWRKIVQSTYRRNSQRTVVDPVERNRELTTRYAEFLGALAFLWTSIERYLDSWVEIVHASGGSEKIQRALPPNLDRELDYLKSALKCGIIGAADATEAARLIQEIHCIKNFRHALLHGVAVEMDDSGRVIVELWRVRGAARTQIRTPYTRTQLLRHYARTYDLAEDLYLFLSRDEDAGETPS